MDERFNFTTSGASPLRPADAALAAAVVGPPDDTEAPYDLSGLAGAIGTSITLLESVARAGLLIPHHTDPDGTPRYSAADMEAVRAGLALLDAGLPLAELLALAGPTDRAVSEIADLAVEAFPRFVRDPVLGQAPDDHTAASRLIAAYGQMLPATERVVANHFRRKLIHAAFERLNTTVDGARESPYYMNKWRILGRCSPFSRGFLTTNGSPLCRATKGPLAGALRPEFQSVPGRCALSAHVKDCAISPKMAKPLHLRLSRSIKTRTAPSWLYLESQSLARAASHAGSLSEIRVRRTCNTRICMQQKFIDRHP